jgi:hypothetical protein
MFFFSHSLRQFGQAIVPLQGLILARTAPVRTITRTSSVIRTRYFNVRLAEQSTALYQLQSVDIEFNFYCTLSNTLRILLACVKRSHLSL